ncbi:cation:proton antiporter [Aquibacillus sp. LR5S19]|uniref:Cation:proton antiporter n=1 Tax=Aquibacillus rhizosphaerae TaxID=3051431 RepID=A0ABT7LAJ3_9BACI|nr:cation:proton antiporter [Aquibacillus sp. LR5S19]MDL4842878.1 cation:proton antiporter [Aquibacillus sp. LR5S19]
MDFPLSDPVLIFGLTVIIFLVFPLMMKKFRLPAIIGPIIAGIIVGPNGLHILQRGSTIELLGTVGLLFIIFIAGLELDMEGFKKYRNRSLLFGLLSFNIPLVIGTVIGLSLGFSWAASILIGSIIGSHTLLGYPIASRLGVSKNKAVTTAIGGTLVTDTLAMLVLAVITGTSEGEVNFSFWLKLIVSTLIFTIVILFGTPLLSKWFFKNSNNDGTFEFNYVLVILFTSGALALFAGLQPIIGAFLAGLSLNRYIIDHGPLMNRLRFSANALFIPFFLLSVGMLMDLRVLISNPSAWIVTLLILISVVFGKAFSGWITSKIYNYSSTENKLVFGLSISQAAATLASTLVGYEIGLLNQETVNAVIVMILVTCVLGPYFTEKYARKLAVQGNLESKKVEKKPERILIPLANPNTMESLLDLGFIIRKAKGTEEPIYPLTVVPKAIKKADRQVAEAEKMLGHTVMYASGAEVPIRLLTRVDENIGRGLERAVIEERITTTIVGWNGKKSVSQKLFGGIIDNFLDHTNQRIIVAKLVNPLNTTDRIILVLPKYIISKPGFHNALAIIKGIAIQLSASIHCVIIKNSIEEYRDVYEKVKPSVKTDFFQINTIDSLFSDYMGKVRKDDLIIIMSARKGTIAWKPELEVLPGKLTELTSSSYLVFYPSESDEIDVRGTRGTELPKEVLFKKDYND